MRRKAGGEEVERLCWEEKKEQEGEPEGRGRSEERGRIDGRNKSQ